MMKMERTVKSCKKLKDYPPIPPTPPPSEKKEKGLIRLEEELEYEKKYMTAICLENKELEEILHNYDKDIAFIKSNFPQNLAGDGKIHANNEFWFKYESQVELNRKLEREKKHLLKDIQQIEEQGMINLDSLTQSELILYVKQLERTKTDLLSDLRAKEWGLDKQAKDIHHLNEMKKALQAEIRHYDKEFALFRHYKKTSCPSASPTGSRLGSSYVGDEKRLKMWKQKEGSKSVDKTLDKQSSLSQEDIVSACKSDIMFSSLDESKLERIECESSTPGFQRRAIKEGISEKKRGMDAKKGPVKKATAITSLPELSKTKSKILSPTISKNKRAKAESKVGNESPKPNSENQTLNKPIKIIVTYETQTTTITEKKVPVEKRVEIVDEKNHLESSQSVEDVYEDDFEDSDIEKQQDKNSGFLTTRVKKNKAVRLKATGSIEYESKPELEGVKTKVQKIQEKPNLFECEPPSGKQIVVTIRIFVKVLPNGQPVFTFEGETAPLKKATKAAFPRATITFCMALYLNYKY